MTDMPYIDIAETPLRKPAISFTPGYELAYQIDPDGDTVPVFTDWTQNDTPERDEA